MNLKLHIIIILGIFAFLFSFFVGILSNLGITIIFARAILSGILFALMGALIAYLLENYFPEILQIKLTEKKIPTPEERIPTPEERIPLPEERIPTEEKILQEKEEISPIINEKILQNVEEETAPDFTQKPDLSIPLNEEPPEVHRKIKNGQLGKFILEKDKKIINDPEVLAKAIRTMLNKE